MESIKNNPNFELTVKVTEKLLMIQKPIKTAVVVVSMEGSDTAGSIIVGDPPLTEQARFNILLHIIEKMRIPWSYVTKGEK